MSAFFYKLAQDVTDLPIVGPLFGTGIATTAWYRYGISYNSVFLVLTGDEFPMSDVMNSSQ
jgi:hypothetical protein